MTKIAKSNELACSCKYHAHANKYLGLSRGHFLPRFGIIRTPYDVTTYRTSHPATTLQCRFSFPAPIPQWHLLETDRNQNLTPTGWEKRLKRGALKE